MANQVGMSLHRRTVARPPSVTMPPSDLLAYAASLPDPGRATRHRHTWDASPLTGTHRHRRGDRLLHASTTAVGA